MKRPKPRERRGLRNGESAKMGKKTKAREEEERETHLKPSLKNQTREIQTLNRGMCPRPTNQT